MVTKVAYSVRIRLDKLIPTGKAGKRDIALSTFGSIPIILG